MMAACSRRVSSCACMGTRPGVRAGVQDWGWQAEAVCIMMAVCIPRSVILHPQGRRNGGRVGLGHREGFCDGTEACTWTIKLLQGQA